MAHAVIPARRSARRSTDEEAPMPGPARRSGATALVGGLVLAGALLVSACSTTETVTTPPATTSGAGTPTTAAPTTAARTETTAGSRGSTGTTAGGSSTASGEGPCGYLTTEEVTTAIGVAPEDSSVVRGGCRWVEGGSTPVVDLQIESPDDPAKSFATEKSLYGATGGPDVSGIGEDAFVEDLDQKVVFLAGDKIYTVWVQADVPDEKKLEAGVALATLVSGRL